jgi:predicted small lipoprotein YifL
MRKVITLFLTAVLVFSLAACGSGSGNTLPSGGDSAPSTTQNATTSTPETTPTPEEPTLTKEEMLAVAELVDLGMIYNDMDENKIKAKKTYTGNIFEIPGFVYSIENDYCILKDRLFNVVLYVYLPEDDLLTITKNERITVVGVIDFEINKHDIEMPVMRDVYLVSRIQEISGTVTSVRVSYSGERSAITEYQKYMKDIVGEEFSEIVTFCIDNITENHTNDKYLTIDHFGGILVCATKDIISKLVEGREITITGIIKDNPYEVSIYDNYYPLLMGCISLVEND